ncbi:MAG TPA: WecB/TagA/CpsF family glycosyltransferase [Planctomycetota bacterium]|jgi:N-acetylglucosaminyldiphosphoundecaprenol N-acetyl-beta-D-mannosaminyltransferase|nr:WecB/TagA/CpsF family glycosyltransferase [Planctomycetota bacterium]
MSTPPVGEGAGCVLLGVRLEAVSFSEALERMGAFAAGSRPRTVVTVNLDFLARARRDPQFRDLLNRADLRVADGMPLVWASRLLGRPLPERVAGIDLFEAFATRAAARGFRIFLLGAAPGVAERAAAALRERSPGLQVAGTHSPPIGFEGSPSHEAEALRLVEAARPHALFTALSTPRGQRWIERLSRTVPVPLSVEVGAAFDVVSGGVRRAPAPLRRAGLEWLVRLAREPRRLGRRYLVRDLAGLGFLLADAWKRRART